MRLQETFLPEERVYNPLPDPCPGCNGVVGVVTFRHGAITGLRCRGCDRGLDLSIVRLHPLERDCHCGAKAGLGTGFLVPQRNADGIEQFCILCGVSGGYVKKSALGMASVKRRPAVPYDLEERIRAEAAHACQTNHETSVVLHIGHCLSVCDAGRLNVPDDITWGYWNLYLTCAPCNQRVSGRGESVNPEDYIRLYKKGEYRKARPDAAFLDVLKLLRKALTLPRRDAA